jgi:hypothetical protein
MGPVRRRCTPNVREVLHSQRSLKFYEMQSIVDICGTVKDPLILPIGQAVIALAGKARIECYGSLQ